MYCTVYMSNETKSIETIIHGLVLNFCKTKVSWKLMESPKLPLADFTSIVLVAMCEFEAQNYKNST